MLGLQLKIRTKWKLVSEAATRVATTTNDFHYESEYKVLICKVHKKAVKGLERHLKDAHGLRRRKE
jgi:hypothetical protein